MIYDQTCPLPHQIRCGLSLHNTASPSMLMIPYSFQNQFAAIGETSHTADLCMHSASSIPLYVDDLPISSKSFFVFTIVETSDWNAAADYI